MVKRTNKNNRKRIQELVRHRRQSDILEAAAWVFKNQGFATSSLDQVASRAGINKATIFYYFPNKEHLLYEVLCHALRMGAKKVSDSLNFCNTPLEKLQTIIRAHLRFNLSGFGGISVFELKNLPPGLRKSYVELRDQYEQMIAGILQEAVSASEIRQGDPKLWTRFILGLLNSVSYWFKKSGHLSIEDVGNEICNLFLYGTYSRTGDNISNTTQ